MFGKNEVTSPFRSEDGDLLVNELWYTIQGEGPDAGCPAIFLRLAKCNLRCFFCDTEFERGTPHTMSALAGDIRKIHDKTGCRLLVITGGEPLLQNFIPLVAWFNSIGGRVSIETAGTLHLPGLDQYFVPNITTNLIVCSPKTPKLADEIKPLIHSLKYIISVTDSCSPDDGLPIMSTQRVGDRALLFRPHEAPQAQVYLQPMDEGAETMNQDNLEYVASLCMEFGYRLSYQLHKLANLP